MDEYKNLNSFGEDWIASATISPTLESTVAATQVISKTLNPRLTIDIPLVFIAIAFMLVIRFFMDKKSADNPADPSINEQNQNANTSLSEKKDIQNLTIEDWAGLYNKTFDSDPDHRMVLKSEHISSTTSTEFGVSNTEGDTDIESGEDKSNKTIHEDDAPSYSLILDVLTGRNKSRVDKTVPEISGTCVICLEEFEAGDEVVWSSIAPSDENAMTSEEITASRHGSCQHVYHQDCMVQYLASHTYRKFRKIHLYGDVPERGKDIETPCPTCRRNFCILGDEDLGVAIKTRCLEIEEEETSSHTSANSIEGSTDEEESQEGLSASESTTQEHEEQPPVAPLEEEEQV